MNFIKVILTVVSILILTNPLSACPLCDLRKQDGGESTISFVPLDSNGKPIYDRAYRKNCWGLSAEDCKNLKDTK